MKLEERWEKHYGRKLEIAPVQERTVPDFMHEPETVEVSKLAGNISAFPEKCQIPEEKCTNPEESAQKPEGNEKPERVTGEVVDCIDNAQHAANWQQDAAKTQQAQEGATGQQAPEEAANMQQAPEEATGQQVEEDPFFIVKGLRGKIYTLEAAMNEGNTRIIQNLIPEMIEGLKTVERLTTGI